jgi:hypothetical protein
MTNPFDILLFIDKNTYEYEDTNIKQQELTPGSIEGIEAPTRSGFLFGTLVFIRGRGGQDVEVIAQTDDFTFTTTPRRLLQSGINDETGLIPAITRFDEDSGIFVLRQSFQRPVPFNDLIKISTRAPANQGPFSVTIRLFLASITDRRGFFKDYLTIINPQLVEQFDIDNLIDRIGVDI